jgi:hypothetical protein
MFSPDKAETPRNVVSKVKTKVETACASVGSVETNQQSIDCGEKEEETESSSSISVISGDSTDSIWFNRYPHSLIYKH